MPEVEQAFANRPLAVLTAQKRRGEERVLCAGLTDVRGRVRVITAHTAKRSVRKKL
jgi:predicted pyridoxine 5'-phosphate oxidase superfamily flavin-nucleotide-binding protein